MVPGEYLVLKLKANINNDRSTCSLFYGPHKLGWQVRGFVHFHDDCDGRGGGGAGQVKNKY
jgi:hypothetical protein